MRHILAAALLATTAAACTTASDRGGPAMVAQVLPEAVDPSSYARPAEARVTHVALDLNADFEAKRLAGTATLDVQAAPTAREIVLDTKGLAVRSVTDGQGRALPFEFGANDDKLGAPLTIQLNGARRIKIDYLSAPEAEALTGLPVRTTDDLKRAGDALLAMGAHAVLMKGGHIDGPVVVDLLLTPYAETRYETGRIDTRHTHGTGCTLASACAVGLAQGMPLEQAVARAWAYTAEAIRQAPNLGKGHGPLGHGWPLTGVR